MRTSRDSPRVVPAARRRDSERGHRTCLPGELEEGLFEVVAVGGQLGDRSLRDQAAVVDDHHGVDGLRDLGEHVAGDQHGAALRRRTRAAGRAASGCPPGRGRWRARRGSAPPGRRAARSPGRAAAACRARTRRPGGPPRPRAPTRSRTSSILDASTSAASAWMRRCARAVRPGWKLAASSTAPTWCSGSGSSAVRLAVDGGGARVGGRPGRGACGAWWSCPRRSGRGSRSRCRAGPSKLRSSTAVTGAEPLDESLNLNDCHGSKRPAARHAACRRASGQDRILPEEYPGARKINHRTTRPRRARG